MKFQTDSFEFSVPPDWKLLEQQGSRITFRGNEGQDASLSVASIKGEGSELEAAYLRNRLRINARIAMETAAKQSGLPITKPLSRNLLENQLTIDEIECRTRDRALLQCAVTAEDAVLLLTYDTPLAGGTANPLAGYAQIVNSIAYIRPKK